MQVKLFAGFTELDARRKLREWQKTNREARIYQVRTLPPAEGIGRFEGRSLYQIVVAYEPQRQRTG